MYVIALRIVGAESESSASQHDTDKQECDRNVKRRRDRSEGRRECGEENYDDKYQPNVIRFPHWSDGVGNQGALLARA